jgi:hypothetical protein
MENTGIFIQELENVKHQLQKSLLKKVQVQLP